jgi:hypothetical protein
LKAFLATVINALSQPGRFAGLFRAKEETQSTPNSPIVERESGEE